MARFHPLLLVVACAAAVVPSLAVPDLYRFGEGNGDTLLFPNDDGSSPAVSLRLPFPFFDEEHSQLFVRKPASSCRRYIEHVWFCVLCFSFVVVYYDAFVVNNTNICCYKYLLLYTY